MPHAVIPLDLARQMVRERYAERLSFTALTERYPLYGRRTISQTLRRVSHRDHFVLACAWCKRTYHTRRPDKEACGRRCYMQRYRWLNSLTTAIRPPEAPRLCQDCGADLSGRRADAKWCDSSCRSRSGRRAA